jgi:hypothetical protein
MSDPGSTYRTRDEISGVRQVCYVIQHVNGVSVLNFEDFFLNIFSLAKMIVGA